MKKNRLMIALLITGITTILVGCSLLIVSHTKGNNIEKLSNIINNMEKADNYTVNSSITLIDLSNDKNQNVKSNYYWNQKEQIQSYFVDKELIAINDYKNRKYYSKIDGKYSELPVINKPDILVLYQLLKDKTIKNVKKEGNTYTLSLKKDNIISLIETSDNFYGLYNKYFKVNQVLEDGKFTIKVDSKENIELLNLEYLVEENKKIVISSQISDINLTKPISIPVGA